VRPDLISVLRLSLTNEAADCCTVPKRGCGVDGAEAVGAQSRRFEQVTPTSDQKAEVVATVQLQRWGPEPSL